MVLINWQKCKIDPLTFTLFHFSPFNFQFCQFSPLTFNFCQCRIPLKAAVNVIVFLFFFKKKKKISELKEKKKKRKKEKQQQQQQEALGEVVNYYRPIAGSDARVAAPGCLPRCS